MPSADPRSVREPSSGPDIVRPADDPDAVGRIDELIDRACGGAGLVVAAHAAPEWRRLTGVRVVDELPRTEWFVTLSPRAEAARLDGEVPVASALSIIEPVESAESAESATSGSAAGGPAEVAATTSVRFEHRPTIAVRRLGAGRVVTLGCVDVDAVMAHDVLGPFVRRLASGIGTAPSPSASSRELGVAVVGYGPFGGMGYAHGLACTETDGLRLVAAVDPVADRLKAAQDDFPDVVGHDDVEGILGDDGVDVVIVATPPVHHAELAKRLLRAGKHVVVEKPMCLTVADADEMIELAAEHERVLTVHQSRRWDRDYLALRRAIEQGSIGEPFVIETFVGGFEHPCRAWHSEEAVSGGAVYDWGSHHLDWILQLYGGPPSRVMCTTHTRVWHDTTNVDQLAVWMRWDDGREATFRQSDVAAIRRPKFYVQGTEGTIEGHYRPMRDERIEPGRGHLDGWSHHAEAPVELRLARYESGYGTITSELPTAPHPGWGFHRNLADHLLLGEPLAVEPAQSRDVVRVLEAAHRSGAEGGTVVEW